MRGGDYEGPRVARAGETRQLRKFLNRIFADGCPAGMEKEYPHLYGDMEKNLDFCHVITFRGRIVAHVGIYPLNFVVGERRVLAGGIGAVCTDESHRGKGLMSELLEHSTHWMRGHGMPLSILWGDAVRYGRFGWRVAGMQVRIGLHNRALPALAKYRGRVLKTAGGEAVADELYALHQKLRFRVARGREEFGLIMGKIGRRIYTARAGKRITAYCMVRSSSGGRQGRAVHAIDEWAGSGSGILSILDSLLRSDAGSRVDISLPAARLSWWTDLLKGVDSWGLDICGLGQIKIIDRDPVLNGLGISNVEPYLNACKRGRSRDLAPILFGPLPPSVHFADQVARKLVSSLPVPLFLFPSDHV